VGAMPLRDTVTAGFTTGPGGTRLVLHDAADAGRLHPGMAVELRRRGLLVSEPVGRAAVAAGSASEETVPAAALVPSLDVGGRAPALTLPLDGHPTDQAVTGEAEVAVGLTTVADRAAHELIIDPI